MGKKTRRCKDCAYRGSRIESTDGQMTYQCKVTDKKVRLYTRVCNRYESLDDLRKAARKESEEFLANM